MLCKSPCFPRSCVQQPYSSETQTTLSCLLNHVPVPWELGATRNPTAHALSSLFRVDSFRLSVTSRHYQVHRHPKQRRLFCCSDCRYKDVLGLVIKGDHSSDKKTIDNNSTVTDLTVELCWRTTLSRLGDTLKKHRLVTWETKISKFGKRRRKLL